MKRARKAGQAGPVSLSKGMLNPCPPWGSLSLAGPGEVENSTTAACSLDQTMKGGRWGMRLAVLGQAVYAITGGQSCIFCLVRPCAPRLPQGSIKGSHQNAPKVCTSKRPCWGGVDEVERQAGESQNPTCSHEHTWDTH